MKISIRIFVPYSILHNFGGHNRNKKEELFIISVAPLA